MRKAKIARKAVILRGLAMRRGSAGATMRDARTIRAPDLRRARERLRWKSSSAFLSRKRNLRASRRGQAPERYS